MPILIPFEDGEMSFFDGIIRKKKGVRRTRLRNLRQVVEQRYSEYSNSIPQLETLTPQSFGLIKDNDLRHCYNRRTNALDALKVAVKGNLPNYRTVYCQYCLINAHSTFDHYLPKSTFPEYSTLARNLVPSCPDCNHHKGEAWLDQGKRSVYSLYYDNFPVGRYLFVDIRFPAIGGIKTSFKLQHTTGLTTEDFGRLTTHFRQLDLIRRLSEAGGELASYYVSMVISTGYTTRSTAYSFLTSFASELEAKLGSNYWHVVLLQALANSNEFFKLVALT